MSFSLSGSVITQSGIDADLTGLAGISGVTTYTYARPDSHGSHTTYNIKSNKLEITGTLTLTPSLETLITEVNGQAISIKSGGNFTVDNRYTDSDGNVLYGCDLAIQGTMEDLSSSGMVSSGYALVHVERATNNEFHWYGGIIRGSKPLYFGSDSTTNPPVIEIKEGVWDTMGSFYNYPPMVRNFSTDTTIQTMEIYGGAFLQAYPTTKSISKLFFKQAYGVTASGYMSADIKHTFRDYQSIFAKQDFCFWSNRRFDIINSENGSDAVILGLATNDSSNKGCVAIYKEVDFHVVDEAGNNIPNVVCHFHDVNNGSRKNFNFGDAAVNEDFTQNYPYIIPTQASGKTGKSKILLAVGVRDTGGLQGTNNSGDNAIDYRGKNGDTSDVFDGQFFGYKVIKQAFTKTLKGNGTLEEKITMKIDATITESDPVVVQAYTHLDTAEKIYDRLKTFSVQQFQTYDGEVLVERVGKVIRSHHNIIIDKNALTAVSIDTTTHDITLKADICDASFELSPDPTHSSHTHLPSAPAVTLQNGATLAAGRYVIDTNGDSFIYWKDKIFGVYPTLTDAQNRTNKIGDSNAGGVYRFTFDPAQTILELEDGRGSIKQITVKKGPNTVQTETLEVVQDNNSKLERMQAFLDKRILDIERDTDRILANQSNTHDIITKYERKETLKVKINETQRVANKWSIVEGTQTKDTTSDDNLSLLEFSAGNKKIVIDIPFATTEVVDYVNVKNITYKGSGTIDGWIMTLTGYKGATGYFIADGTNGSRVIRADNDEFQGFVLDAHTHHTKTANTGYDKLRLEMSVTRLTGTPQFTIGNIQIDEHYTISELTGIVPKADVVKINATDVADANALNGTPFATLAKQTAIENEIKHDGSGGVAGEGVLKKAIDAIKTETNAIKTTADKIDFDSNDHVEVSIEAIKGHALGSVELPANIEQVNRTGVTINSFKADITSLATSAQATSILNELKHDGSGTTANEGVLKKAIDAVKTETNAIKGKTDDLQFTSSKNVKADVEEVKETSFSNIDSFKASIPAVQDANIVSVRDTSAVNDKQSIDGVDEFKATIPSEIDARITKVQKTGGDDVVDGGLDDFKATAVTIPAEIDAKITKVKKADGTYEDANGLQSFKATIPSEINANVISVRDTSAAGNKQAVDGLDDFKGSGGGGGSGGGLTTAQNNKLTDIDTNTKSIKRKTDLLDFDNTDANKLKVKTINLPSEIDAKITKVSTTAGDVNITTLDQFKATIPTEIDARITKVKKTGGDDVINGVDQFKATIPPVVDATIVSVRDTSEAGNIAIINGKDDFKATIPSEIDANVVSVRDTTETGNKKTVDGLDDFKGSGGGAGGGGAGSGLTPTQDTKLTQIHTAVRTDIPATITTLDGKAQAIKNKSDKMSFSPRNKIDANIDEVANAAVDSVDRFKADVSGISNAPVLTAVGGVKTVVDGLTSSIGSQDTEIGKIITKIDAIKVELDHDGTAPSGGTLIKAIIANKTVIDDTKTRLIALRTLIDGMLTDIAGQKYIKSDMEAVKGAIIPTIDYLRGLHNAQKTDFDALIAASANFSRTTEVKTIKNDLIKEIDKVLEALKN